MAQEAFNRRQFLRRGLGLGATALGGIALHRRAEDDRLASYRSGLLVSEDVTEAYAMLMVHESVPAQRGSFCRCNREEARWSI